MENNRKIPQDLEYLLHKWDKTATALHVIILLLATIGIVAALAVTGFTADIGDFWTRVLAFTSAVSFGLLNGLNIPTLATNFRSAWRHFNSACIKYKLQASSNEEDLVKAYSESEAMIGHLVVSAKTPTPRDT